jgi:hypothetical protein
MPEKKTGSISCWSVELDIPSADSFEVLPAHSKEEIAALELAELTREISAGKEPTLRLSMEVGQRVRKKLNTFH